MITNRFKRPERVATGSVAGGGASAATAGPRADAIVVLGCPASPRLDRRIERAIELYRAGAAPLLVASGGGRGRLAEAEIVRRAALAHGIPEDAVRTEPRSRDTFENARNTARILRPLGLRRVVLVSDRTHLPRARLLFRLEGVAIAAAIGVPAPSWPAALAAALRETAALPWSLGRRLLGG